MRDVTQEMVFDFKELLKNKNWTKDVANQKMSWNKIREVFVEESHKILYKYNLDDDQNTLIIRKETRNRSEITLKKAYSEPVSISNDKFKDLMNLSETGIIPSKYHDFFSSLPHGRFASNDSDSE